MPLSTIPTAEPSSSDAPTLVVTDTRLEGRQVDVVVSGKRIASIEPHDAERRLGPGTRRLDGSRTAILPGLLNSHTHTAMALLRSYADDMPLMPWLEEVIWPFESRLTEDDVYWGARLGCLEMIRTGTTFFCDMYWFFDATARAVDDCGMRAVLAAVFIDMGSADECEKQIQANQRLIDDRERYGDRIGIALGPHALYTVSEKGLRWVAETSERLGSLVHMHLSETDSEVQSCVEAHGVRPVEYADRLGLLSPRLLAAHAVHLTDEEIEILAARGVHVLHNPVSNMKLASGGPMRYRDLAGAGVNVLLGTDGAASNNNLDLFEEMKFASLMAKHSTGDPTALPAREVLGLATANPARAFGLDVGSVEPGMLADFILIDLDNPFLFPGHELIADLVYSAHGRAVEATVCDGQVLMEHGIVADEEEIRGEVASRLERLVS